MTETGEALGQGAPARADGPQATLPAGEALRAALARCEAELDDRFREIAELTLLAERLGRELEAAKAAAEQARAQVATLTPVPETEETAELWSVIRRQRRELADRAREAEKARRAAEEARKAMAELAAERDMWRSEAEARQLQVESFLASTSWRVTAPLRGLARLLGRGEGQR